MTEEIIRCPNCGTENNSNDHFCQECGKDLSKCILPKEALTKSCEETNLRQDFPKTENSENLFEYINIIGYIIGYFIKLLLFVVPAYFLYLGYNLIFETTETFSDYGMDFLHFKNEMTIQLFAFGIGVFLLLFLFITVVYVEIILNKFAKLDKKIEKLSNGRKE